MLDYPGLYEIPAYSGPSVATLQDEVEELRAKIKELDEELTHQRDETAYWQQRAYQLEEGLSAMDEYGKDGNF